MKENIATYRPDSSVANIHGMVEVAPGGDEKTTCRVSANSDSLCTGCCEALHVLDDKGGVFSEIGEKCEHQISCSGCKFVKIDAAFLRPGVCSAYHCSQDLAKAHEDGDNAALQRLTMANEAARQNNEIPEGQKQLNLSRHIPYPPGS